MTEMKLKRIELRRMRDAYERKCAKRRETLAAAFVWTSVFVLTVALIWAIFALLTARRGFDDAQAEMERAHAERVIRGYCA